MRKTAIFFLILLLPFRIPLVNSAPDEGYGEANDNLGQFTDTFENDDYVSVAYQVINNVSLECMELDIGVAITYNVDWITTYFIEYFETFTAGWAVAQGNGGSITRSSTEAWNGTYSARILAEDINDYCYAYKSMTTSTGDSVTIFHLWASSGIQADDENIVGLYDTVLGAYMLRCIYDYHDGSHYIKNAVSSVYTDVAAISSNEWVEIMIYFNDTSNKVHYYVNGEYEGEFDANNGAANPNRVYIGDVSDESAKGFYYLDDLIIGNGTIVEDELGYYSDGYFTTEDYLNYTQGKSLALLTIADLPALTSMTVAFSSDNVTWVDNHGNAGSSTVRANFSALDLRDLNYADVFLNYTLHGPGGSVTPRLNQSRIITTEGIAGEGITVIESDAPWIALAIILSIIAFLLATRIKR